MNKNQTQIKVAGLPWLGIALFSLVLSALLAMMLIVFRLPFGPLSSVSLNTFKQVLVLHVDLSMMVWLMSLCCWLMATVMANQPLSRSAPRLALSGILLLLAVPVLSKAPAITSNYVPVLDSPAYLLGLWLFSVAIGRVCLQVAAKSGSEIKAIMVKCMAVLIFVAIVLPWLTLLFIPATVNKHQFYEAVFWGAGHVMQLAVGYLLATLWLLNLPGDYRATRLQIYLLRLPLIASLIAIMAMTLGMGPTTDSYHTLFRRLMEWTSWIPMAVVVVWRLRELLAETAVVLSVALVGMGIFFGLTINLGTLSVPAHYHAMLGACNLAVLGYGYKIVSVHAALDRQRIKVIYFAGIALLTSGLYWAGYDGGVRKVTGGLTEVTHWSMVLPYIIMGIGGLIMFVGTLLLVWLLYQFYRQHDTGAIHVYGLLQRSNH